MCGSLIKEPSAHKLHPFGSTTSIGAVVEEVPALVTDKSESCWGDALVRSFADSPLLSIEEPPHHLPKGQDFDCFASVGSGSEVDLSLLCQTQCFGFTCC